MTQDAAIQFLDKGDVKFYKEAEKNDHSIKVFEIDEEDFLYLNWREEPPLSSEEITEIFRKTLYDYFSLGTTPQSHAHPPAIPLV